MPGGPESGGFGGSETAIEQIAGFEARATFAEMIAAAAHEASGSVLADNPELAEAIGRLIEQGPEWDPYHRAHMRRVVAWQLSALSGGFDRVAAQAETDITFFNLASKEVQQEIDELESLAGEERLPDLWDVAIQDLLSFGDDEKQA